MRNLTLLLILSILLIHPSDQSEGAKFTLGEGGEILAWLISKPFPNPSNADFSRCEGFDADYVGGEQTIGLADISRIEKARQSTVWQPALADPHGGVDFAKRYKVNRPSVVYAYTTILSPLETDAVLLIGSDDGVKVWLNGKLIHSKHLTRGVKRDEDRVDIKLRRGANRLLFKVDQHYGGWGLVARITKTNSSSIQGLLTNLDIASQPKQSESSAEQKTLRIILAKPGVVDTSALYGYVRSVQKIERWKPWLEKELSSSVQGWLNRLTTSKNGNSLSSLLKEATSDLSRKFDLMWSRFEEKMQNPPPLRVSDVPKQDYIEVAQGGRYFVHSDGRFYTPIGYNHNPDWTPLHYCAPGLPDYNPKATEDFFKKLRDSGVNLIRMMVEFPAGGHFLEKPVGKFRPEHVVWLDAIFEYARKYDIKLMVTAYDTFWMNHRWDENPFNGKNGGPVDKKLDFITRPEAIEAQKRRWKYIIDRWGNTGTVFAWELLNEADYWWGASPEQVIKWATEMGDYVRTYEKAKWGRNHLITVSTGRPMPSDGWATLAYHLPGMDFATTHLYIGASNAPDEPIGPAHAERQGVMYALAQIKDRRPYIDGENGPINRWIADENLDNEVFHNMSWAHLASGGAGSGLRWPYRGPHHLTDGMLKHLSRMNKFAQKGPWGKLIGDRSDIVVSTPDGGVACATATKQCAIVWVATPKQDIKKVSIRWPDSPPLVRFCCFDTKTGEWFSSGQISTTESEILLDVPGHHSSIAVILE